LGRLARQARWSAEVSALAAGPVSRAWLFSAAALLPLKRRLLHEAAIPVRADLGGTPRWFWFSDESELLALKEIFAEGEYAAVAGACPTTIVDLGANVGQAALWFRSRFPDARILSVEPDPRTFAKLRRNLGKDPLVTLRRAAITARDGVVELERAADSSWGTRVSSDGAGDVHQVPGVSLVTLLAEHGVEQVDLLKVDIEGLEHAALGASPALARATLVIGEIHATLIAVPIEQALEDMRACGGFDRCELDGDIFVLSRDSR
jgi:FkbM family methyltransferase